MANTDPALDPGTPEWAIAYAAKRVLRRHLGPRHQVVPEILATAIADHLRLCGWRFVKDPPRPLHSTPGPGQ